MSLTSIKREEGLRRRQCVLTNYNKGPSLQGRSFFLKTLLPARKVSLSIAKDMKASLALYKLI